MAYFDDNCNFYSSPSTPEELGPYPFLQPQASVVAGEIYNGATPAFAGGWATVDQPGFAARPLTAQPTTTNYFDSYPAQQHGSYWPTIGQSTQPDHTSVLNQGSFPLGGEGWGTGIPVLPVNPVPTNSWGSQPYGLQTNGHYIDNILSQHRPQIGASRTGMGDSRRFMPYGVYVPRHSVHGVVEAGPSTQRYPHIPYGTLPTIQPTGRIPETTANAEQNESTTEEEESSAAQTRLARGEGPPRLHRGRAKKGTNRLRAWAKVQGGHRTLPSHQDAITTAADILTVLKPGVYDEDRLVRGRGRRTKAGSKNADEEFARRNGTRLAYQRLSRHYGLELGQTAWSVPRLLSRVLEDLENLDDLIEQFVSPPSTAAG